MVVGQHAMYRVRNPVDKKLAVANVYGSGGFLGAQLSALRIGVRARSRKGGSTHRTCFHFYLIYLSGFADLCASPHPILGYT